MKCARTTCLNKAHPLLKHKDNGKLYCPRCARAINSYSPSGNLIPWPTDEELKKCSGS